MTVVSLEAHYIIRAFRSGTKPPANVMFRPGLRAAAVDTRACLSISASHFSIAISACMGKFEISCDLKCSSVVVHEWDGSSHLPVVPPIQRHGSQMTAPEPGLRRMCSRVL